MAEEIESLVVSMKPEGLGETTEGLETVEEQTQETAESMEDQSEQADSFADKFQGAMAVAVSALAIGATGLLRQVPILGEAMSGVFALIDSLAFRMDSVLRPVLSPIVQGLFRIANIVGQMNGPLGTIVGIVSSLGAAFGGLVIVGKITGLFSALAGASSALTSILTVIAGALTTLAGVLGLPVAGVAALIAGVAGLVAIFATDFLGIRTKVVNALKTIWGWVTDLGSVFLDLADKVRDGLLDAFVWLRDNGKRLIQTGISLIVDKAEDIFSFFTDDLPGLAKDGIDFLVQGIKNKVEDVKEAAVEIKDGIIDKIPGFMDMADIGANIIDGIIQGITDALSRLSSAATDIGGTIFSGIKDGLGAVGSGLGDLTGSVGGSIGTAGSVGLSSGGSNGINNAQFATPRGGSITLEVDGQTLGEVTDQRQRGFTSVRNIDG